MAKIGDVDLDIDVRNDRAIINVKYALTFEESDKGQRYNELCRLIGDDTDVGDPPEAGDDDPLAFLAPLYFREIRVDQPRTHHRRLHVELPSVLLDEDFGPIPDPDEFRALVTLVPVAKPVRKESDLVVVRKKG
ncbi:MAG TPA: hypothetical protein VHF00_04840 [Acidimicrobiales bacterium]|jgi:hypothetical protein|nr:hypothetical protein [Acidimicrobiales bacterium]